MSDETKAPQVFVVQRRERVEVVTGHQVGKETGETAVTEARDYWVDLATITLPAHTPRRIAIKEALKDSGLIAGTGPVKLRALDVKSAEVFEPESKTTTEWVI